MSLDNLQRDLVKHDAGGWQHESGVDTDKHNFFHVAKTMGRIGGHLEAIDDEKLPVDTPLPPELIADLAIFAARFATNSGQDLTEIVAARMQKIHERQLVTDAIKPTTEGS